MSINHKHTYVEWFVVGEVDGEVGLWGWYVGFLQEVDGRGWGRAGDDRSSRYLTVDVHRVRDVMDVVSADACWIKLNK